MDLASRDIISSLPEPLICHILSFLPQKKQLPHHFSLKNGVICLHLQQILSLMTQCICILKWKQEHDDKPSESFMGFVDRVLALQGNAVVNRFSLHCADYVGYARIDGWMYNVLRRGVSDLCLSLIEHTLSSRIFVSKTLVRLKLGPADDLSYSMDDVSLPKLKTLYIDSVVFVEESVGFAKLLSCCPVIEELVVMNIGWE